MAARKKGTGARLKAAAGLCYLFGPLSGTVGLIWGWKNKVIRFNAAQALAIFFVWWFAIQGLTFLKAWGWMMILPWTMVVFSFWLVAMVKAWQGKDYQLPLVGKLLGRIAGCRTRFKTPFSIAKRLFRLQNLQS